MHVTLMFERALNSCLINKYCGPESNLPRHSDNESTIEPGSSIFTISLGTKVDVTFTEIYNPDTVVKQTVAPNSLYVMSHKSQTYWEHEIKKCDSLASSDIRYSLTFRHVSKKYNKSSIIIGDSNTYNLKFGEGVGTFGHNIPGKRVEAYTIHDINPVDCCGYRNIFIHCGINDIKEYSITGPAKVAACFRRLADKVNEIKLVCPRSKVYVSPILPTKDRALNERCLYFNKLLFEFIRKSMGEIQSHDFNVFLDKKDNGMLSSEMGRYNKPYDTLHLGAKGLRKLVEIIRLCVYGNLRKSDKTVKTGKLYTTALIKGGPESGSANT